MALKRITTKEGEVYFIDAKTGDRVKTDNDKMKTRICNHCGSKVFEDDKICSSCNSSLQQIDPTSKWSLEVITELKIKKKKLLYFYLGFLLCLFAFYKSLFVFPTPYWGNLSIIIGTVLLIVCITYSYGVQKILQFSFGSKNSAKLYLVNSIIIAPAVIVIPAIVILEAKATIKKNGL